MSPPSGVVRASLCRLVILMRRHMQRVTTSAKNQLIQNTGNFLSMDYASLFLRSFEKVASSYVGLCFLTQSPNVSNRAFPIQPPFFLPALESHWIISLLQTGVLLPHFHGKRWVCSFLLETSATAVYHIAKYSTVNSSGTSTPW